MNLSSCLLALMLVTAATPVAAQPAPAAPVRGPRVLTADEQATLRCSAAFAIVSAGQARGDAAALRHPPLGTRGREFFVITAARLMDEAGLDQAALTAAMNAEAAALQQGGVGPVMPFCLQLLDAANPPK